jgi:hypothetical protein
MMKNRLQDQIDAALAADLPLTHIRHPHRRNKRRRLLATQIDDRSVMAIGLYTLRDGRNVAEIGIITEGGADRWWCATSEALVYSRGEYGIAIRRVPAVHRPLALRLLRAAGVDIEALADDPFPRMFAGHSPEPGVWVSPAQAQRFTRTATRERWTCVNDKIGAPVTETITLEALAAELATRHDDDTTRDQRTLAQLQHYAATEPAPTPLIEHYATPTAPVIHFNNDPNTLILELIAEHKAERAAVTAEPAAQPPARHLCQLATDERAAFLRDVRVLWCRDGILWGSTRTTHDAADLDPDAVVITTDPDNTDAADWPVVELLLRAGIVSPRSVTGYMGRRWWRVAPAGIGDALSPFTARIRAVMGGGSDGTLRADLAQRGVTIDFDSSYRFALLRTSNGAVLGVNHYEDDATWAARWRAAVAQYTSPAPLLRAPLLYAIGLTEDGELVGWGDPIPDDAEPAAQVMVHLNPADPMVREAETLVGPPLARGQWERIPWSFFFVDQRMAHDITLALALPPHPTWTRGDAIRRAAHRGVTLTLAGEIRAWRTGAPETAIALPLTASAEEIVNAWAARHSI